MRRLSICIVSALLVLNVTSTYHILAVFPFPTRSHGILADGHVKRLLDGGHEVTYITPFPKNGNNPKLHEVAVPELLEEKFEDKVNLQDILNGKKKFQDPRIIFDYMLNVNNKTFHNSGVQRLMRDRSVKFDAILVQWMFSETLFGFAPVFDAPLIIFSTTEPHTLVLNLMDEHTNPAYVPNILSSKIPPLSFVERVQELLFQMLIVGMKKLYESRYEKRLYDSTFGQLMTEQGRTPPSFNDLQHSISLQLGNSHVSLGGSVRLPQSYKPIGGYHIDDNLQALPKDLQVFLDSSKNGVIYFSMGSNLQSKNLPDSLKNSLLKMFGSLKQNVIWKFEEVLPDFPSNVRILKWAPQPSILAHPNCILFITHGGLLSTTETVHFGKPVIGIPVFADQFINVERAQAKGYAKKVNLSYTMADDLKVAIEEMLSHPSYAKRAKELSLIYHDRPMAPGKELVHWVEHVIKTGGAPHLRSPALHVPWYQKTYLDFLALIITVVYSLIRVIKLLCSKKKVDLKKKKN